MRDAYINSIYKATELNKDVLCIVGDIGAFLLRNYIKDFPHNFYNLGAAEANMVGVAAGLAKSGKIPFVYTITPFITARCYEQIKVDVCYNNANVKLVGIGSGVSYSTMGSTHHSLADIAIMRALPNMVVLSPADPPEVEEVVMAAMKYRGPVYIRLTLQSKPLAYKKSAFRIGKARIVRKGRDAAIIAAGDMVSIANDAAEVLLKDNIDTYVVNMHTIKPLDETLVKKLARSCKAIVSIEEHSTIGGLGSAVSSVLSQQGKSRVRFKIMGFEDVFCKEYSKDKLKIFEKYGLSANHLADTLRRLYT
jgi:transketolase